MKRLIIGLEDHMPEPLALQETVVAQVPEILVQSAALDSEIYAADCELSEIAKLAEDAERDAITLSEIQEVLVKASENGEGADVATSEIARITVESICARLGIKARAIPSMEAFASVHSRLTATKIAIEGIGAVIVSIWEAIISVIKRIITAVGQMLGLTDRKNRHNEQKLEQAKSATVGYSSSGATASHYLPKVTKIHYKGKSDYSACLAIADSLPRMVPLADKMSSHVETLCSSDFAMARNGNAAEVFKSSQKIILANVPHEYISQKQGRTNIGVFSKNKCFVISEATVNGAGISAISDSGEPLATQSVRLLPKERDALTFKCEELIRLTGPMNKVTDKHNRILKELLGKVEHYLKTESNREVASAVRFSVNLSTIIVRFMPIAIADSTSDLIDYVFESGH